ncbi:hypothetical protein [Microterricola viridarii]|uniref:Uncharacterized protein n=1 Tax=Microterricola viridarii TaxID=412690 RepID=A0A1H1YMT8_9MICO|nr:hypothetical protein [Microterricola viridarii]SDT22768.1 hypothetical protein SAMN04489834_3143 [Microterricola viridarii]
MDITLPTIPLGVLTLLALFAPCAVALINQPAWPAKWKRAVGVIMAIVLAAVVLVLYYVLTGDVLPDWPWLLLLAVLVSQTSYALLLKPSATRLESSTARHL